MLIGVPLETAAGETRVAVTPETAKKLKAQGHTIRIQSGAGIAASVTDAAYTAVGAEITDQAGAFGCDLVLKVRSPLDSELPLMKTGAALVGMLNPFDRDGLHRLVVWAERRSGTPVGDPAELVEAAAELGLLVESGAVAGERWCRHCRAGARQAGRPAVGVHALAA